MAVKWTDDQQNVINARGSNLLVSAAAGSGKTAVLVERIIRRILDDENPIDIDRLLVVTFTRAAAAEMRERVTAAIEKRCIEEPDNDRLQRQQALVHNAQITTIDSFCAFIVRNHFGDIGIEPNFRVADQGELELLKQDVIKDVFEECYKEADNEASETIAYSEADNESEYQVDPHKFLQLVDAYSGSRNDAAVKDMVLDICRMSESSPWPKEWVAGIARCYQAESPEEFKQTDFMQEIISYAGLQLKEAEDALAALYHRAKATEGLENYAKTLENDVRLIHEMNFSYERLYESLKNFDMGNMARVTKYKGDESVKKYILDERNKIKKEIESLRDSYFSIPLEDIYAQTQRIRPMAEQLIALSLRFLDAYSEAKRQKRMVSFADMEHFALNILVDEKTKELRPAAGEFKDRFDEIMVDEYQDSNQVQEEILTAISRESRGEHNMFMVGDIKQSIYRFRLARPEIFMGKFNTFEAAENAPNRKITLSRNFRSRTQVLDFVNDIFVKIMQPDLGGVAYDADAMLYKGADYPDSAGMEAEVLLYDSEIDEQNQKPWEDLAGPQSKITAEESPARMEIYMIAIRIRQLLKSLKVRDDSGQLRPLRYGDIAILMRGVKSSESDIIEILSDAGIPVQLESSTGYFSSQEVRVILAFLQILDNPLQDIPLAAVLKSPIAGLSDDQLAQIRIAGDKEEAADPAQQNQQAAESDDKEASQDKTHGKPRHRSFSEAAWEYLENAPSGSTYAQFYELYTKMRGLVQDTPVHELIQRILSETGYRDYVCMLPAGHKRAANLDMLVEKAADYEQTSYKGLFHFVRYIEKLHKYDVDFGEAQDGNLQEDAVSVMTIHKSKGLEFPVVFVAGIGRKLNQQDSRQKMLLHSDLGIGLNEIQLSPKRKYECLIHHGIADRISRENLGEELRILYVGMTRAKEKLILTGTVKDYYAAVTKCTANLHTDTPLPFTERFHAGSYLDWILPAIQSYPLKYEAAVYSKAEIKALEMDFNYKSSETVLISDSNSVGLNISTAKASDSDVEKIRRELSYVYPYTHEAGRKSKYSVSELKHNSMLENYDRELGEAEIPEFLKEEKEPYIPTFVRQRESCADESTPENISDQGVSLGALRGTAVHRVMECLDFHRVTDVYKTTQCNNIDVLNIISENALDATATRRLAENVCNTLATEELSRMQNQGLLSAEYASLVPVSMISAFLQDPVALRMAQADARGELFREKPFVMEKDGVLIQGIVDAFWKEDGRIVLLDYKTDAVRTADDLVARYQTQLQLYAEALSRLFGDDKNNGKSVNEIECMMYSFRLRICVNVPCPTERGF